MFSYLVFNFLQSSVKTLSKQVRRSLEEQSKKADERRKKLGVQRLTKRKRLGRGRYEPYLEPVLLANELTPTLRQLKPQGDIFQGINYHSSYHLLFSVLLPLYKKSFAF